MILDDLEKLEEEIRSWEEAISDLYEDILILERKVAELKRYRQQLIDAGRTNG